MEGNLLSKNEKVIGGWQQTEPHQEVIQRLVVGSMWVKMGGKKNIR